MIWTNIDFDSAIILRKNRYIYVYTKLKFKK